MKGILVLSVATNCLACYPCSPGTRGRTALNFVDNGVLGLWAFVNGEYSSKKAELYTKWKEI